MIWLWGSLFVIYLVSAITLVVTFSQTGAVLDEDVWSAADDEALRRWAGRHPQTGPGVSP